MTPRPIAANDPCRAPPPLAPRCALFLDFDGTLVDIAPSPGLVIVPAALPHLLVALSERLDGALALVSGRTVEGLAWRLAPFAGPLAGQHGLERRCAGGTVRSAGSPALDWVRPVLAEFALHHAGAAIEDKGGTIALHYRQAPALASKCRETARRAVAASAGTLRMVDGRMVVELVPTGTSKARAIADFLAGPPFRGRCPVFIGDDTTDEDGFVLVNRLDGIAVRVGDGETAAPYRLAAAGDVLAWLAGSLAQWPRSISP